MQSHWVNRALSTSQRLPVGPRARALVKDWLYARFPAWFAATPSYRHWRSLREDRRGFEARPLAEPPSDAQWDRLSRHRADSQIDRAGPLVVVPVYGAAKETQRCLAAVLAASPAVDLWVVDDASPDLGLREVLASLSERGLFRWVRNVENRGFAGVANQGIEAACGRDLVLLNSDTEVFPGWLERLAAAAHSNEDVASVTPLSNNAEILSYPDRDLANPMQLEIAPAELAALAARVNARHRVTLPTGIGFCLYLRADALEQVGAFDEQAFAGGYGEETDWCLRASLRGYRHLVATDVYVWHEGASSFGSRRAGLRRRAAREIARRHPRYEESLRAVSVSDPLLPARRRLDAARLRRAAPHAAPDSSLLFVCHDKGGGTERYAQTLATDLEERGANVFWLRPGPIAEPGFLSLGRRGVSGTPGLRSLHRERDFDDLLALLRILGIDRLHVHHLAGLDEEGPLWLLRVAAGLGRPFDVTLHDYTAICPRMHLVGRAGRYCGEPPVSECQRCVEKRGSEFGTPLVWAWRARYASLLERADQVFCPSEDTRRRVERYFPGANLVTRPPDSEPQQRPAARHSPSLEGPCVIASIGALTRAKGFDLLLACARDARARGLPLRFEQIGFSADDAALRRAAVRVSGWLDEAGMQRAIQHSRATHALLLSRIPETWSYALSDAFAHGLTPIAFDLGAPAERIREAGRGELLPVEAGDSARAVNDLLVARLG